MRLNSLAALRLLLVLSLAAAGASAQSTVLVSQSTAGVQSNGDSRAARISDNGQWVVFKSDGSNLVGGDTNGVGDVFVRNVANGATSVVSFGLAGADANGESFSPAISAGGGVIVYHSDATNLVAGDTNVRTDVFAFHAGAITRCSVASGGAQSNGASTEPAVSGNGAVVVYQSNATNLVAGDSNSTSDVFWFDRGTSSVVRASVSSTGAQANGASTDPWTSSDGRYVAFASLATNLVTGDTNGVSDVFVRDMVGGTTTSASIWPAVIGNGSSDSASISGNGRWVAFRTDANNLVVPDTNVVGDVLVADLVTQTLWRASESSGGLQANGSSTFPQISGDGLFATFTSAANNLVAGDVNARDDVFVRDLTLATTQRASIDPWGAAGNDHSRASSIANGGARVAFKSEASNLVGTDLNAIGDVFLRQPAATTWHVDVAAGAGGSGSPSAPFQTLQQALANPLLASGDEVVVAPGVYVGTYALQDLAIAIRSTAGRDVTILDGGSSASILSIQQVGVSPIALTLEGFTLRNGWGSGCSAWGCGVGGGVFFYGDGALTFTSCRIENCAGSDGAAIYTRDAATFQMADCIVAQNAGRAAVTISGSDWFGNYVTSCAITSCTAEDNDGGAFHLSATSTITLDEVIIRGNVGFALSAPWTHWAAIDDCTIEDNGSAMSFYQADGVISHTVVGGNGGGLSLGESTYFDVVDSTFEGNQRAINNSEGVLRIYRTTIDSNIGAFRSGPIGWYANARLYDCVITRNQPWPLHGAPIYLEAGGGLYLENCTIAANGGTASGSIELEHVSGYDYVDLNSCIVSSNSPPTMSPAPPPTAYIVYSALEFAFAGTGNTTADPKLWDPQGGDAHLLPGSPCIDAGDPALSNDPDGSRNDIGALPFDGSHCGTPRVYCTAKLNSLGCAPAIGWTGTPSAAGASDDFHVTAAGVLNNKNGLLFWGVQPAAIPFQGGTLCVQPPIVRTPVQQSGGNPPPNDCSGSYSFHFTQGYMQQHLVQFGATIHAQYWARDPGFAVPNNVSLSDGLRFVVCQ